MGNIINILACAEERTPKIPNENEQEITQTDLDAVLLNIETERFRD